MDSESLRDLAPHGVTTDTAMSVPTYDGSNVAIHPSVVFVPSGWAGHQWWMAMTPYPGSDNSYENPSIVCSDDGRTWAVPDGLTNPVIAKPTGGYNSDPALALGPDGIMHMWFREKLSGSSRIKHTTSEDGVTWTNPTTIYTDSTSTGVLVSPAFFYDGSKWVMIAVFNGSSSDYIVRGENETPDGAWPAYSAVTVSGTFPNDPFHLDARLIGGLVVAAVKCEGSASGRNYLCWSTDLGKTFTVGRMICHGYKLAVVPAVSARGLLIKIMYATLDGAQRWMPLTCAPDTEMFSAAYLTGRYKAGDTYRRADATSLGTADSGQAYTVVSGTPGISANAAYPSAAGNTRAYLETGVADAIASLTHKVISANADQWMTFRLSDGSSYFRLGMSTVGNWQLQKVVAGSPTTLWTSTNGIYTPAAGDRVTARYVGDKITVFVNDAPLVTVTDSFNNTATKVGLMFSKTDTRVTNLAVRAVA